MRNCIFARVFFVVALSLGVRGLLHIDWVRRVWIAHISYSRRSVRPRRKVSTQREFRTARNFHRHPKDVLRSRNRQFLIRGLCIDNSICKLVSLKLGILTATDNRRKIPNRTGTDFMSNIVSLAHIHYNYILCSLRRLIRFASITDTYAIKVPTNIPANNCISLWAYV